MQHATAVPASPADPTSQPLAALKPLNPNGSPGLSPSRLRKTAGWRTRTKLLVAGGAVLVILVCVVGATAYMGRGFGRAHTDLVPYKVKYERLPLTIVEKGTLESKKNNDIKCTVKARTAGAQTSTTIRWILDDGTHVAANRDLKDVSLIYEWNEKEARYDEKPGPAANGVKVVRVLDGPEKSHLADVVIELDDSGYQDTLKTQSIDVDKAESDKIQAEEKYRNDVSQNKSDILAAENTLKLATLDYKKYTEGDYPASQKQMLGNIKMGESDVEQQRERVAWMQRMVKRGYQTQSTLQSEQSRLESFELSLARYNEDYRVLTLYTKEKEETDRKQKVNEAKLALERVNIQAKAKEAQATIDRDAKTKVYKQQVDRYKDLKDEIRKCKVPAPQDGMVVYFADERGRMGIGRQAVIGQGETVSEGQTLMRIPDLKRMAIDTRVHEALISRVKPGQTASIKCDSAPDRILTGHVDQVATVAAQTDWFSSDVKVYQTKVAIDEYLEGLKPGMTAEVTITTGAPREHVLAVPVQAIIGGAELGGNREIFVITSRGPERRSIVLGDSNDKMVEVVKGLEEGDEVVLNPKALLGEEKVKTHEPGKTKAAEDNGQAPAGKGGPGAGDSKGGMGKQPGGPGGPGGAPGAGKAGAAGGGKGGFPQPTAEQKKQWQENLEKLKKAKPEERKKLFEQMIPDEERRTQVKPFLKQQGIDIPD
jgi:multidrug resistance efflux pump